MLQLGFDYTPLESGLLTFTAAVGAFTMKSLAARIIRRFGFRRVLIVNALISSAFTAACAAFTPATPFAVMVAVLLIGGFFRSLQFTATNTIAYADVDPPRMSRATALVSVAQQLSIAAGVAVGALAVELAVQAKGAGVITAADFRPAFLLIGAIAGSSALLFWSLPPDAGSSLPTARRSRRRMRRISGWDSAARPRDGKPLSPGMSGSSVAKVRPGSPAA